MEKEATRDRDQERSTCGGEGGRSSVGQGNKEGATAREGDSGVAELSVTSHYSESANDGPPDNPADVYGVPPPTDPTAERELSAHAESGSYAFLNSSPVQEANGGNHAHESDAVVPQQVAPGPRDNFQATDGASDPPSYARSTPLPKPESLSSRFMNFVAEISEKEQRVDELEEQLSQTKAKLSEKEKENQQLRENVDSVTREKESLELQLKKAREDMERMKARATFEGEKLKQEKEETKRLNQEIDELEKERDELKLKLEQQRRFILIIFLLVLISMLYS